MLLLFPILSYLASSSTVVTDDPLKSCYDYVDWVNVPGTLSTISVGSSSLIFGTQSNGKVFLYLGYWIGIPGIKAGQIEIGNDGELWMTNPHTYRSVNGKFINIPDVDMQQISVANIDNVWGRDFYNNAYFYTSDSWIFSGAQLEFVSTAADGSVWGIMNGTPVLLEWSSMEWYEYPAPRIIVQIAATEDNTACAVGSDNSIWCIGGDEFIWFRICGTATWMDFSSDGNLWIVDSTQNGAIYHS